MKPVYTHRSQPLLFLISLASLLVPLCTLAEGTKQVMPNANNGTGLIVSTTAAFPLGNVGSYLNAPIDDRIFIHIKDFTAEKLYYGFNWETLSPVTPIVTYSDVYMNLIDPTGAPVPGSPFLLPTAGNGFISSYLNAIQGPKIGGTPVTGYAPLTFTPAMNGDYYVSFYRSSDGGVTHLAGGESMLSKYFDLTVAAGNVRETGRVHCNEWAMSVYNPASGDIQDPLAPTNAQFFGYTADSVTIEVSFPATGFQPLSYIIAFNSFGVINSGNWQTSRQSIVLPHLVAPYLTGGYLVFLTPPDPTIYPPCVLPSPPVLLDPVISGCPPGPYNIRFQSPQPGDYYLLFDLNGIPGYQSNSADRLIELDAQAAGIITYSWNGLDGLGNPVPANTSFPITFSFRKGRINIPFYDVELNVSGFNVAGISPAGAVSTNPTLYWDDTQLTNNGSDCSNNNNNYTGSGYDNSIVGVTPNPPNPTTGRAWDGNGNPANVIPAPAVVYTGIRNDSDNVQCNDYGNARLLNTWAWGIVLNSTQTLTLTCVNVSGTVWDDADNSAANTFNNIRTNNEPGTNAGAALYASLVDPVSGDVVSSVAVAADGTYTLNNLPVNSVGMKIYITTTIGVAGSLPPSPAIPGNWINTSPLIRTFTASDTNVVGQDFGIEQLPNSDDQNYTIGMPGLNSFVTLNGSGTISSPGPLSGSDPEDGILGAGRTLYITSVPSNEQIYYSGTLITSTALIPNYQPFLLQVKFTDLSVTSTSFTYAYVDKASKEDPTPATYTINVSIVLANTLSSFSGRSTDQGNLLTWTSYDETAATNFVVQRSTAGGSFAPIGNVPGTGDGTTINHNFTDNNPVPGMPNDYRLQWTDGNGNIAYSNTVTLAASNISTVMDITPNPFRDQVTVRLNLSQAEPVAIRVLDGRGMLVRQIQTQGSKGANSILVNGLSTLPVSVYFIQIVLPDQVMVKKAFNNR
jgi:hypothetical protein